MENYLLNENTGLFADYLGLQYESVLSASGEVSEPVEWRADLHCGKYELNSLGTAAKCNHPFTGDDYLDFARCCRTNRCEPDFICNCPMCTEFSSIDEEAS